jgi:hypothetical protein
LKTIAIIQRQKNLWPKLDAAIMTETGLAGNLLRVIADGNGIKGLAHQNTKPGR